MRRIRLSPEPENENTPYSGRGWDLLRVSALPETITAPAIALGSIILAGLFALGVFLISRLVLRVADGSTDTVPAASAALTAIAAVFGAVFITWRTVVAHWQARASQQQVEISRNSHYTTLFAKAVEQLGSTREIQIREIDKTTDPTTTYSYPETQPNLEVRLGAIYALERIARDSVRDKKSVFDILCAYARNPENSGKLKPVDEVPTNAEEFYKWQAGLPSARVDMQACIYVLGSDLYADFEANIFDLSRANFQSVKFSNCNLSGANLEGANLDATSFDGTVASQAILDRCHVKAATVKTTSLNNSSLDHADISFCRLSDTSLIGSEGRKTKFSNAILSNCDLRYCHFKEATFTSVTFQSGICSWISLKQSHIDATTFRETDAQYVNFRDASLFDTSFFRVDLRGSDFSGSTLYKTGFFGCDLTGVTGMTAEMLAETYGDHATILPDGITHPDHWSASRIRDNEIWAIMNPTLAKVMREHYGNS